MEESITNSPQKSNTSIREARQKRLNKRKEVNQCLETNSAVLQTTVCLQSAINEFYKDSDDEFSDINAESKNSLSLSAIVNIFKPFELEKKFLIADRVSTNQVKQNPNNFPQTQGFIPCTMLAESDLQKNDRNQKKGDSEESLCIITESELISCCHQAEQIIEISPLKQNNENAISFELSPNKNYNMELANSILSDFSQSPLSKNQLEINYCWQYSPEFRLRRKPLKTYSRKFLNSTKANLSQRFEKNSPEHDDCHSRCSSLSIQEDVTIRENINQEIVTNSSNTQRLCENLLNLTEYFTQNESQEYLLNEPQQQVLVDLNFMPNIKNYLPNVPDVTKDVSTHCNRKRYSSSSSNEDFLGFANEDDNKEDEKSYTNMCDKQLPYQVINKQDIFKEDENCIYSCFGFKTASSKPIKVSENAHIIAGQILSKLPDIPALNGNDLSNNHDTSTIHKDVDGLENPEDYEWNDDCDLFLNIQTPIVLKENTETTPAQKYKACDSFTVTEKEHNMPTTSKMAVMGFKTAGGKNLKISEKAQTTVQKLLNECNDCNYEEDLKAIKCQIYAKTHSLKTENTTKSEVKQFNENMEFQSAKGKNILISATAQQNVKNLFKEKNYEISLEEMKQKMYKKNVQNKNGNIQPTTTSLNCAKKDFQVNSICNVDISKAAPEECKSLKLRYSSCNRILEKKATFNAANSKSISTTTEIENNVQTHLEELNDSAKDDMLNDEANLKACVDKTNDEHIEANTNPTILYKGLPYQNINVLNEKQFEKCSQSDVNETTLLKLHYDRENRLNTDINMGFHSANGKKVLISKEAQQIVNKLFQKFDAHIEVDQYEKELIEMKTKIECKSNELKLKSTQENRRYTSSQFSKGSVNLEDNNQINSTSKPAHSKRKESVDNITMVTHKFTSKFAQENKRESEDSVSLKESNQLNSTSKLANSKRKNSIDNIDTESSVKTPPFKMLKNSLHSSKSLFAEHSLKSPLNSGSRSIIAKKNLLSLTKRRKSRRSLNVPSEEIPKITKEMYNLNANAGTPIKSNNALVTDEPGPDTPILKEFFSKAALTSTPRINNLTNSSRTLEDSDLKPIDWKNNDSISNESTNKPMRTTKLVEDNMTLNITINSSKPTPKERIGRLKMYGKATAVSPILIETHHNCRPSGLRRTRSMLKKTEM